MAFLFYKNVTFCRCIEFVWSVVLLENIYVLWYAIGCIMHYISYGEKVKRMIRRDCRLKKKFFYYYVYLLA